MSGFLARIQCRTYCSRARRPFTFHVATRNFLLQHVRRRYAAEGALNLNGRPRPTEAPRRSGNGPFGLDVANRLARSRETGRKPQCGQERAPTAGGPWRARILCTAQREPEEDRRGQPAAQDSSRLKSWGGSRDRRLAV